MSVTDDYKYSLFRPVLELKRRCRPGKTRPGRPLGTTLVSGRLCLCAPSLCRVLFDRTRHPRAAVTCCTITKRIQKNERYLVMAYTIMYFICAPAATNETARARKPSRSPALFYKPVGLFTWKVPSGDICGSPSDERCTSPFPLRHHILSSRNSSLVPLDTFTCRIKVDRAPGQDEQAGIAVGCARRTNPVLSLRGGKRGGGNQIVPAEEGGSATNCSLGEHGERP